MIIYNKYSIDQRFNENIIPLDIKNYSDLEKKIKLLKKKKHFYNKKINSNFKFYNKFFNKLEKQYQDLILS